jgi:hypothetical protein
MKPTALHIERWLDDVEARIVPPERPGLRVIIHELREGESREKAFAEMVARYPQNVAGKTVDDLNWSDDLVGAQEKAVAEHIAAHPEDAGRTVKDFGWIVREIVHVKRREDGTTVLSEPLTIDVGDTDDTDLSEGEFEDTDKDTDGPSETLEPIDLPPPDPGCLARSKPWRPVHQRPARDMRRPTWKKWER